MFRYAVVAVAFLFGAVACQKTTPPGDEAEQPKEVAQAPAQPTPAPTPQPMNLTSAELYKEYVADHKGAFTKHQGQTIVVSGTVWGVAGAPPFRIGLEVPGEASGSVMVQTDETAAKAAGLDQKGAKAKLSCTWKKQDVEAVDISLSDCAIVN